MKGRPCCCATWGIAPMTARCMRWRKNWGACPSPNPGAVGGAGGRTDAATSGQHLGHSHVGRLAGAAAWPGLGKVQNPATPRGMARVEDGGVLFAGTGGAGGGDGGGRDGLIEESGLGGGAAGGDLAEAGGADSNVGDEVVFDQGEAGEGDLGDGLGGARA